MGETGKVGVEIRILTLLLCATDYMACIILLPGTWKLDVIGILIGSLTGIMGFNMIRNMIGHIDGKLADIKSHALRSYIRRYMLYAVIFVLGAVAGAHITALLVEMLPHKCSILIYSWEHRKEDK